MADGLTRYILFPIKIYFRPTYRHPNAHTFQIPTGPRVENDGQSLGLDRRPPQISAPTHADPKIWKLLRTRRPDADPSHHKA